MTEFTHKGVLITVTLTGAFMYRTATGKNVTKPSLKAAQNAIDKEIGAVSVLAMSAAGRKLEISGVHRTQGFLTKGGYRVGQYQGLYNWDEEAAQKLEEIGQRRRAEDERHREASNQLDAERSAVLKAAGNFEYGKASAEAAAAARATVKTETSEAS